MYKMETEDLELSTTTTAAAATKSNNNGNSYSLMTNTTPSSTWLEIRLFYVRISPCSIDSVLDRLTLRLLRRHVSTPLEINGVRIPSSDAASVTLRRDRLNKESSEVTYVSTDSVRVASSVEFEVVIESGGSEMVMVLCGSVERMESAWGNNDEKWSVECYVAAAVNSSCLQLKSGAVEVYIAGCCGGVPVILTKTIMVSPRRRGSRCAVLDSIPEDEELEKVNRSAVVSNGLVRHRKVQIAENEDGDDDELDVKYGNRYYSEDMYYGEDGQLSWFNAGVRVGVGIGLGMCLGIGIGVGLLMRSYQATTRNFRRRFL